MSCSYLLAPFTRRGMSGPYPVELATYLVEKGKPLLELAK